MSERHATSAELELYVLGALDGVQSASVESHCAACHRCAAALAGEARLELAFVQVAKRSIRSRVMRPLRASGYMAAGLLAVAAAMVVWMGRAPGVTAGSEGSGTGMRHPMDDAAILDARNDALDGG